MMIERYSVEKSWNPVSMERYHKGLQKVTYAQPVQSMSLAAIPDEHEVEDGRSHTVLPRPCQQNLRAVVLRSTWSSPSMYRMIDIHGQSWAAQPEYILRELAIFK